VQAPALSEQLAWTTQVVHAVLQGRSLTTELPRVPGPFRPGTQSLVFEVLRRWGEAQMWVQLLSARKPSPTVQALLGLAACLLTQPAHAERNHYAPHTVVDQAVQAARILKLAAPVAGFINACLRRLLREQAVLEAQVQAHPLAQTNHPSWWVQQVLRDNPEQGLSLLQANQHSGPLCLRVNTRKVQRVEYLHALHAMGLTAVPNGVEGITLDQAINVEQLPGWAEGWVSVQDAGAQLAAHLLLDVPHAWQGKRVLDACAAPGGKTAHLLERADVQVWALDVDAQRCERIHRNLQRLGLKAKVQAHDAARTDDWWDGLCFDAVLLDAPCTASGIVRRHPDVRWLRRETDIAQLAQAQQRLLKALWPTVSPGGRLLYCTCSVFKAEGQQQIDVFLHKNHDATLLSSPGHLAVGGQWQINDNVWRDTDGFYYALLHKLPA
jgi:16S rRNA (cytosine967-C5)-methyltransferase